jgi:hypothetical protein
VENTKMLHDEKSMQCGVRLGAKQRMQWGCGGDGRSCGVTVGQGVVCVVHVDVVV